MDLDTEQEHKFDESNLEHPRKKKKLNENLIHPYGVLPLGNMYTASTSCRFASLGYFATLEDDTIIEILG
jgi:hypothetical protein